METTNKSFVHEGYLPGQFCRTFVKNGVSLCPIQYVELGEFYLKTAFVTEEQFRTLHVRRLINTAAPGEVFLFKFNYNEDADRNELVMISPKGK